MAGTIVGSIDHKGSTSGANAVQEQFKILFDFLEAMDTAGHCTRIALQYGTSGTGTDFHDDATPFGENAFAVYTFGTGAGIAFDLLIQYAYTNSFGASPGNPGALHGTASTNGVGIAIAAREDGSSPWAGGTANAGADTKGATVWTAGGSAVHVVDRACSTLAPAGSFSTNMENTLRMAELAPNAMRMHCVGDADCLVILCSENDDGGYACFTAGRYTERAGISSSIPLYALTQHPSVATFWADGIGNAFGTSAGNNANREGGILGRLGSDLVAAAAVACTFDEFMNSSQHENQQLATPELDAIVPLFTYNDATRYGMVGTPDGNVLQVVHCPSNHSVNGAATRTFMSVSAANSYRWSIPWDGGAAPGIGGTRAGRQF